MTRDWSPRTFRIGIAASLAVLLLQWGGVPVIEALNPLSVAGCSSPRLIYVRAPEGGHVSADVDESPVKLVNRKGEVTTIPARFDQPIMVLEKGGERHGPLLLQGIDRHHEALCAWTEAGTTACIALADIRAIYLIHQGNLQKQRRRGLAGGAIAGAALGMLPGTLALTQANEQDIPLILCISAAVVPVTTGMGALAGVGTGEIVGRIRDQTDAYVISPEQWRFQEVLRAPPSEDPSDGNR